MKHLRLLRGLPSSGKSFLAAEMAKNEGAFVVSDDDFLNGNYFAADEKTIEAASHQSQMMCAEKMCLGVSPIVVDNCNLKLYYLVSYVRLAHAHGYEWSIIDVNTPWCLDLKELARRKNNTIPYRLLEELKKDYQEWPSDALRVVLKCEAPIDPDDCLRKAMLAIEKNLYSKADEQLFDYQEWRKNGFRPPGGDEAAESIADKLTAWRNRNFCPNQ